MLRVGPVKRLKSANCVVYVISAKKSRTGVRAPTLPVLKSLEIGSHSKSGSSVRAASAIYLHCLIISVSSLFTAPSVNPSPPVLPCPSFRNVACV